MMKLADIVSMNEGDEFIRANNLRMVIHKKGIRDIRGKAIDICPAYLKTIDRNPGSMVRIIPGKLGKAMLVEISSHTIYMNSDNDFDEIPAAMTGSIMNSLERLESVLPITKPKPKGQKQ
jgi:hypothetical protein